MEIHYDAATDRLVLILGDQENRTVSFAERDWHLCFAIIKEHGLRPAKRLERRRAIASLGETDLKMVQRYLERDAASRLAKAYPDAIDLDIDFDRYGEDDESEFIGLPETQGE